MNVLKLCIAILLGATLAAAADNCPIVYKGDGDPMLCFDIEDGKSVAVDPEDCDKHPDCCLRGKGDNAACYAKGKAVAATPIESDDSLKATLFGTVDDTVKKAKVQARFLQLGPPSGFPGCLPPVPFPSNCKPQRNEPYVLEPPSNIPYCVRIPCSPIDNAPYEKSHKLCGTQPGCYFDKELYEYREAFGQSVLPGVPVCHLAIRNAVFQKKAQEVVQQYGSWNPYFTNCLLNEYHSEIMAGPKGCELLSVLDVFYIKPKLAGWNTITTRECALIDGCYRRGQGCFYPVDISTVVVKSGQRHLAVNKHEVPYGRPKCQHFDTSSPLNILKSYHQCLSAGCTVDSSVTSLYYNHLFTIGQGLSVKSHWEYWTGVQKGDFGADNIEDIALKFGYTFKTTGPPTLPPTKNPFSLPSSNPFAGMFGSNPTPSQSPFVLPPPLVSGSSQACGHAFRQYDARPCAPIAVYPPKPNPYCPYKPFFVPRFPVLKGKFDGCCDINLCYLPKKEISQMHSGPSFYYSEWSLFSSCSVTCGVGEKRRYRKCVSYDKSRCTESLIEVRSCKEATCAKWSSWGPYNPCPKTCFPGGIQSRTRDCLPRGGHCQGESEEVRTCNEHACGFDTPKGVWTPWAKEGCVYDRSTGMCEESQTRYCMYNGIPGGKCIGSTTKTKRYRCRGCHVIG